MPIDTENLKRQSLLDSLKEIRQSSLKIFMQIYSRDDPDRSLLEAVRNIPEKDLSIAIKQVQRTIKKQNEDGT